MNPYLKELTERYPILSLIVSDVQAAFDLLKTCYENDGVVYICGNGGSASDAEHIVGELMKSFTKKRPVSADYENPLYNQQLEGTLRAFSLVSQTSLFTAFANDVNPDLIFAQQISGYGRPGDVLWALSTSGNSQNVLHALQVARSKKIKTFGMTGMDGGKMAALCDVCIRATETEGFKIQELHLPIYHALCHMLESHFFPTND